ncbi:hypothetical protein QAD02_012886 [Eretmocerus hayati]|uniref:Uncharacterized protein n=1 Tax=Eretmocerus hayati TaxID=131215 RepID=A0ACC2P1A4_9HYME|nr:hypothetical protein QAD02_012886 [Eretmocerus hayati]
MDDDTESVSARRNTFFRTWENSPSPSTLVPPAGLNHGLQAVTPILAPIHENLHQRVLASTATTTSSFSERASGSTNVSVACGSFCAPAPTLAVPGTSTNFSQRASTTTIVSTGWVNCDMRNRTTKTVPIQSLNFSQLPHSIARITASTAQIAPNSPVRALVSTTVSAAGQRFHAQAPAFTAVPGASRNFFPLSSVARAVPMGRFECGLLNPTSETGLRRSLSSSQLPHSIGWVQASTAATATNVPAHTLVSGSVSVAGQCFRAQAPAFTVGPAASTNSVPHAPMVTVCSTGRVNIGLQDPTLKTGPNKSLNFGQLHNFRARAPAQTATATEILHAQAPGTGTVSRVSKSFCAQIPAFTTESAACTEFFPLATTTTVATTDRIGCGIQNPTLETGWQKSLNDYRVRST